MPPLPTSHTHTDKLVGGIGVATNFEVPCTSTSLPSFYVHRTQGYHSNVSGNVCTRNMHWRKPGSRTHKHTHNHTPLSMWAFRHDDNHAHSSRINSAHHCPYSLRFFVLFCFTHAEVEWNRTNRNKYKMQRSAGTGCHYPSRTPSNRTGDTVVVWQRQHIATETGSKYRTPYHLRSYRKSFNIRSHSSL